MAEASDVEVVLKYKDQRVRRRELDELLQSSPRAKLTQRVIDANERDLVSKVLQQKQSLEAAKHKMHNLSQKRTWRAADEAAWSEARGVISAKAAELAAARLQLHLPARSKRGASAISADADENVKDARLIEAATERIVARSKRQKTAAAEITEAAPMPFADAQQLPLDKQPLDTTRRVNQAALYDEMKDRGFNLKTGPLHGIVKKHLHQAGLIDGHSNGDSLPPSPSRARQTTMQAGLIDARNDGDSLPPSTTLGGSPSSSRARRPTMGSNPFSGSPTG